MLNTFLLRMGVQGVQFEDVWGLDSELLQMIPRPCWALCLLYPCAKVNKARREVFADDSRYEVNPLDVFYLKQHDKAGNACGTIALIHSVANTPAATFSDESVLGNFISENRGKASDILGDALCDAQNIQEVSDNEAKGGETNTPARGEKVDNHFVSLVRCRRNDGNWHLCELDGRLKGMIDHAGFLPSLLASSSSPLGRYSPSFWASRRQ